MDSVALRPGCVKTAPKIGVPFAPLPLDVMRSRVLSPAAKLTFMALANHARMRRGEVSNLTNPRIADATGMSEAAVRRGLGELEAAGLVRRVYGASQRVRIGVAVTYAPAEVAQARATRPETVARTPQSGCAPATSGCAPSATHLLRTEELSKTGSFLPLGEEGGEVPDGPTAARYLRAMVAKGRERPPAEAPAAALRVPNLGNSGPRPSQDDARREVERMAGSLFKDARRAAWGPSPGRRRMTPAEIERQLAEVRRKYGGRGTPPQA